MIDFLRIRRVVLAGLVLAAGCLRAETAAVVFLLGDQHSAYTLTAQVVARIDHERAQHPDVPFAVLINGDIFEAGNPIAQRSGGQIDYTMLTALARRGPTVVNIGNHEAEFVGMTETIDRLRETGAIVISNLSHADSGAPYADATTSLQLGRTTLSVVGLATDDLATYPAVLRPTLNAPAPVAWWQRHGADLLPVSTVPVVLSHAGVAHDRELLPLLPAGTLLAGAHNHLRFVHHDPDHDVVYAHSDCWNSTLSVARLDVGSDANRTPRWIVTQESIRPEDPADPELAATIAAVRAQFLTPADQTILGTLSESLVAGDAARWAVAAARASTHADAAFIGNTTFGAGLSAGPVTRIDFDACIRFDGTLYTAEIDGRRLAALLAAANPGPDTPFDERQGEFLYGVGPDPVDLDPDHRYVIATNDWCARNTARYFGTPAIDWTPQPDLKLKAAAIGQLESTQL